MLNLQSASDSANASRGFGQNFDEAVRREQTSKGGAPLKSFDFAFEPQAKMSSGDGLEATDGQTNDPFPPSLAAYIDMLRSVAEYLRGSDIDIPVEAVDVMEADDMTPPKDEVDVAEPTTFAIGEEEMADCDAPMPVEADGGIGDGAGPIPFPPEATTLAIGEEDGGGPFPVEPDGGIGDGAGPPPVIFGDPRDGPGREFERAISG